MKNLTKNLFALPVMALMMSGAHAVDVRFNGSVDPVCSIVVGSDGVMKSSADGKTFGSKEAGGVAGAVVVTSNTNQLEFSAQAPTSFTNSPSGANMATTFEAEYSAVGLGSGILGSTETALPIGITAVTVDLTATKSTGTFPAGAYVADVVVTCD